ncbi:MAG: hypothetical protein RSA44_03245 [Bacteroides sp.]
MKLSTQSHSLIEAALREAMSKFTTSGEQTVVTDIHLQPKQDTGELLIFDDDDEILASTFIDEWKEYESEDFYQGIEKLLSADLNRLRGTGIFEVPSILQPYSFVLVDDDKETVAELLLIDDDTILVNDDLLKGLDEELDDFLKDLLEN